MDLEVTFHTPARTADPVEVLLPPSKSLEARRLMATAVGMLAGEHVAGAEGLLAPRAADCDDLRVLRAALRAFTADPAGGGRLHCGLSGTALRFLLTLCAATAGARCRITGDAPLMRRPMRGVVEDLRRRGARIVVGPEGYDVVGSRLTGWEEAPAAKGFMPPSPRQLGTGQYHSALILCSPLIGSDPLLPAQACADAPSAPYVAMSLRVARGETVPYEADWSAAAIMLLASLLTHRPLRLPRLAAPERSLQGDARAAALFLPLGLRCDVRVPYGMVTESVPPTSLPDDVDLAPTPDLTPPVAVAAALTGRRVLLTGLDFLRGKESDRIASVGAMLRAMGADAREYAGSMLITGASTLPEGSIRVDSKGDHRIAMTAAAGAAARPGTPVVIGGAECIAKSYPDFISQLTKIGYGCREL